MNKLQIIYSLISTKYSDYDDNEIPAEELAAALYSGLTDSDFDDLRVAMNETGEDKHA